VDMKIFKKLHLILISCVVLHSLVWNQLNYDEALII
jgi:hypothetical protein